MTVYFCFSFFLPKQTEAFPCTAIATVCILALYLMIQHVVHMLVLDQHLKMDGSVGGVTLIEIDFTFQVDQGVYFPELNLRQRSITKSRGKT